MIAEFNTETWTDPWFRKLSLTEKILFIYLWTNSHKNTAGLYILDTETMSFETGIDKGQLGKSLNNLRPKIKYDSGGNIVWVVNHVKHQFMRTAKISPKIITSIEKSLLLLCPHSLVDEFIQHYHDLGLSLPLEGIMNRVSNRVSIYPSSEGDSESAYKGEGDSEDERKRLSNKCISPDWEEIGKDSEF